MSRKRSLILAAILCLVLSSLAAGQIKLTGDITGLVVDENGEGLPGVQITLKGAKMFQSSLTTLSGDRGTFRFLGLNPGEYTLECHLTGFNSQIIATTVSVGTTTPVKARLIAATPNQEVIVRGVAPLIETKSAQTSINYSDLVVRQVPTTRNVQDLMEAGPSGQRQRGLWRRSPCPERLLQGIRANAYLLNGVDISDLATGATWVNPQLRQCRRDSDCRRLGFSRIREFLRRASERRD